MGMCKKCGEVFPALEMEQGYCKNCITPELIEKDKNKPKKKNNSGLFSKIESKEDALKTIKDTAIIFIVLGIFNILVGFNSEVKLGLIDGVAYLTLAVILWKWNSFIASIILLLFTLLALFGMLTSGSAGGLIFMIVIIIIAVRSVEATYKLKKNGNIP